MHSGFLCYEEKKTWDYQRFEGICVSFVGVSACGNILHKKNCSAVPYELLQCSRPQRSVACLSAG